MVQTFQRVYRGANSCYNHAEYIVSYISHMVAHCSEVMCTKYYRLSKQFPRNPKQRNYSLFLHHYLHNIQCKQMDIETALGELFILEVM